MQKCTGWRDLEFLWDKCKDDIRQGYPEIALKFLVRQSDRPDPRILDKIMRMLKEHIPDAVPRQVVSCLLACSKMSYSNSSLVDQILQDAWKCGLHQNLKHADVSYLFYALGLLEVNTCMGSIPMARVLLKELTGKIVTCLHGSLLIEVEIVNLVYGLSKLQFKDARILSAVDEVISANQQLEKFTPHNLVVMFYALGQLHPGESNRLERWIPWMINPKFLRASDAIALSSILFTFAHMKLESLGAIGPLLREIVKPSRLNWYSDRTLPTICYSLKKLKCTDPAILDPICTEMSSEGRLKALSNQSFCNVVCGFNQLNIRNGAFFKQAALVALGGKGIQRFSTRELACLLCGFLKGDFEQKSFYDKVISEVVKYDRLNQAELDELSSILFSISQLAEADPDCIVSLLDKIVPQIKHFSNEEISCAVRSLSMAELDAKEYVSEIVQEATDPQRLSNASEIYIAQLIRCMGTLNVRSKDNQSLARLMKEASKEVRLKRFRAEEIAMILFGVGEMRYKTGLEVRLVYALSDFDLEKCDTHTLTTILYGLGRLSFPSSSSTNFLIDEIFRTDRLQAMGIRDLITVLLGMAQMQTSIKSIGRVQIVLNIIKGQRANLTSADFSKVLYTISLLPSTPQDFVEDLVKEVLTSRIIEECDERSLSTIIYSLRRLNLDEPCVLKILCQEASKPSRLKKFSSEALSNLLWSVSSNAEQCFFDLLVDHLISAERLESANVHTLVRTLEAISSNEASHQTP